MTDTLREVEVRQRQHAPASREFPALARQVDDLSKLVFEIGRRQLRNSEAAQANQTMQTPTERVQAPRGVR